MCFRANTTNHLNGILPRRVQNSGCYCKIHVVWQYVLIRRTELRLMTALKRVGQILRKMKDTR